MLPYYYYYLGDEQRIFMTVYYFKNARNFTIHQPSGHRVQTRTVYKYTYIVILVYNTMKNARKKIKGSFSITIRARVVLFTFYFFGDWRVKETELGFTRFNHDVYYRRKKAQHQSSFQVH